MQSIDLPKGSDKTPCFLRRLAAINPETEDRITQDGPGVPSTCQVAMIRKIVRLLGAGRVSRKWSPGVTSEATEQI
jgi:hypothetical protein